MTRHLHATVRGRVQMVGFRYFVFERARALRLTGWVRNGEDGASAEVVAESDDGAVEQLVAALRTGPRSARVDDISLDWSDTLDGFASFEARM